MQSEPVTPITSALAEKHSPSSESCLADNSDRTSVDAPLATEWLNSVNFDAASPVQVRREMKIELLAHFFGKLSYSG